MPSQKHPDKDIRDLLEEAKRKGWRVHKGSKYWKMLCPNECKCWKTVKHTPSGANYLTNLSHFLDRSTCWRKP